MGKRKGSGMIELILAMILLILFGLSTFMLVAGGSRIYEATLSERDNLADRRVVMSYIDNKIRQNDEKGGFSLQKNPFAEGRAIVLEEKNGEDLFQTWIYAKDGRLKEAYFKKGSEISDDMSFEIAKIDRFDLKEEDGILRIEVGRLKDGRMKASKMLIRLQSQ